jgi:D-3-phosphoglycerate dehydrogenase
MVAKSREEFFARSDVISVHVRLNPETKGIITAADFAMMKQRAIFVNTSRAGLVEEGALLAGLNRGHPQTAALDVFDVEPLTNKDDPLLSHPNVIATPHIGFVTEDEFDKQFSDIFEQVNAFSEGAPINVINPETLG